MIAKPRDVAAGILLLGVLPLMMAGGAAACGGAPQPGPAPAAGATSFPAAPELGLTDLGGRRIDLVDYAGRTVIVNFWATWCEPCRREIPSLVALHGELADRGLEVVAVSIDSDPAAVERYIERSKLPFRVAVDQDQSAARRYGVTTVPATFVVNRDGRVVDRVDGEVDWTRSDLLRSVHALVEGPG